MILCPTLRRITAAHARWLTGTGRRARETEAEHAARLLALWDAEIHPHCRSEEEVLLPELACRVSEGDATVLLTLADHVALRRLVRELRRGCATGEYAAAAALERKLVEHTEFEEHTLLPAAQEKLGCDRLAALADELAPSTAARAKGSKP